MAMSFSHSKILPPIYIFSCLEADDSVANLHVFLGYFQQHIHEMQDVNLEKVHQSGSDIAIERQQQHPTTLIS